MRLFRVYVDGEVFYHPSLSKLAITQAVVTESTDAIDSFKLSVPFNHPYLNKIRPMASVIQCRKGNEIVFEGRALDDGSDFYNSHTWTCESCLAYLKDSIQPPFSYKGPLRGLLEYFLGIHNGQVEEQKKFVLGNVTVTDGNDYISYSNSDYSVTMDAIKKKLVETHGGYIRVRYENGKKYLDYISDFTGYSVQKVEFGKNLLDVKITRDHAERVTALIPLGAKVTESDEDGNETQTDKRLDITSVNEGINYIYDADAVAEIGWIWTTEIWDDVTVPSNLLRKGQARLQELIAGVTSMELSIVDESDSGADISDIHAGTYVDCISKPHGIDGRYLVKSRTRDYLKPSGNTIKIGASSVSLSEAAAKRDKNLEAIEDDIYGAVSRVEDVAGKVDEILDKGMYRTELIVDGLSVFRDRSQNSILSCRVYSWDKDITTELPSSAFVWHRKSSNTTADAAWDETHSGMKQITITTEDVQDNASFFCEVTI